MNTPLHRKRYQWRIVSLLFFSVLLGHRLQATTTPCTGVFWLETFGQSNGTTSDNGTSAWTATTSGTGTYSVQNGEFETAFNQSAEGVWASNVIDISGRSNISLSVYVKSVAVGSETFEDDDYIKVYYKLNGGAETLVYQSIAGINGQTSGTKDATISASIPAGSTVQIIIKTSDSDPEEQFYFDNVQLTGTDTNPTISASESGTVTCSNTAQVSVTTTPAAIAYSWTGPNGFTCTSQSTGVSAGGQYTVTATLATGCTVSATATVPENKTAPDITATGGVLACLPTATLGVNSSVSGATYAWTGPNGFTSTSKDPAVSVLGNYTATVTSPANGCTASKAVQVTSADTAFWLETFGQSNGTTSDNGTSAWSVQYAPPGSIFSVQNGEFEVSNSGLIGSTNESVWQSGVIDISGKTSVIISADIRSAVSPGAALDSSGPYMDYLRFYYKLNGGPEVEFFQNIAAVNHNSPIDTLISSGLLNGSSLQIVIRARATGSDEFFYFDNVQVSSTPNVNAVATGGTLGCANPTVTLQGSSTTAGATFKWTGPNNFASIVQNPTVSIPGVYTLTVTNPTTGCTGTATATVSLPASSSLWLETFGQSNGTTSDNGTSPWSVQYAPPGSIFSVQNNEFEVSNSGLIGTTNESVWASGVIDISGKTNVSISANIRSAVSPGAALDSSGPYMDYLRFYYKLNGGPEVLFFENIAAVNFNSTVNTLISSGLLNGNTLQIIIRARATGSDEFFYFDNIQVWGGSALNTVASANGELTCVKNAVPLSGSSALPGVSYSWTGPNNFSSTAQNPTVSAPGIYTLTVSQGGCTGTDTALVAQDTARPAALTTTAVPVSAQLTCSNSNVTFTPGSSTPGTTYAWAGPGGALSSTGAVTVSATGTYTVTATNPGNGCTATASSTVTQNITAPGGVSTTANPVTAQITCDHSSVTLTSNSTTPGVTFSWSDANGVVVGTGATVAVTSPGVYTVSVTDPNDGCVTALPGAVTKNISVPVGLTASPSDIISCFTTVIDLQGGSTTPGATFAWSGPGGFTADTAEAETSTPGSYTLTVTNPANGCTASAATIVLADTATPANVTASNNGPLNCINTSVTITSSSSTPGGDFTWVTPGNSFISGATAVVTVPGTYTIQVTNDENGCFSQATTTVLQNTTGCPGSTTVTPGAVSGRSMEGFSADAVTGFAYKTYPNPFSTTAFIEFVSPVSAPVRVEIYNSFGYAETLLFNNTVTAGQLYKLQLGAGGLSSGTHFCIIRSGGKVYSSKLILIK
jgi:hypothetical protein